MEMIIVVGIMLILTGIGFSNYIFSIAKSRDARRKSDLSTISRAIQAFANDFGSYPLVASGQMVACDYNNTVLIACDWGQPMAAFVNEPDQTLRQFLDGFIEGLARAVAVLAQSVVLGLHDTRQGPHKHAAFAGEIAPHLVLERSRKQITGPDADPDGDQNYYYEAGADGNSFSLYAALENDQDPSYRTDLTQACGSGVTCNYQVTDSGVSVE